MKNLKLLLLVSIMIGCQTNNKMKEHQKNTVESYISSYNEFDIEGMTENLSENVVFKNMSNGKVDLRTDGLVEFKEQAELAKQYFKERKQTIEAWNFTESKVTIEIDYNAILAIELPNGLKPGDTLKLKGTSEFEFKNGKIKSITDKS